MRGDRRELTVRKADDDREDLLGSGAQALLHWFDTCALADCAPIGLVSLALWPYCVGSAGLDAGVGEGTVTRVREGKRQDLSPYLEK